MIFAAPQHMVTYDGAVMNVYHCDKGQGLSRHEHNYAHLTMCHAGSCIDRRRYEYKYRFMNL